MAVPPILGSSYLKKLSKNVGGKLKKLARPLIGGGIGDKMDKGNLWIVPGFTILVFACLWTTKLSKVALEESTCRGASIYDFTGTPLDQDAQRHCQTARRYYVAPEEPFLMDPKWREEREVKNPEWILWFWAPIVFVMYVITRFMWTLLLDNQGINFPNVVNASESVTIENDGISEIDEDRLQERLNVIAENFRTASSSRAFAAFITFEFILVLSPMVLQLFILPMMIGSNYRSWGLDVGRAWWERRDWQGVPLAPLIGHPPGNFLRPHVPLIPRITYCDYHFVSIGNSHTLTYRCYLDANWHERTALFIWMMLLFLAFVNFINLFFWIEWAVRMKFKKPRKRWVMRKWLNNDEDFAPFEVAEMGKFAAEFRTGQLLLFYYIEAHTNRVVASAFCQALFRRWLEKRNQNRTHGFVGGDNPIHKNPKPKEQIGWKQQNDWLDNDPEQGIESAPSPSDYYSPNEAGSPDNTTMPAYSPHRYSASSDSSNSKAEEAKFPVVNVPPPQSGPITETPRGSGGGGPGGGVHRPHYPRRSPSSGNYGRNIREASKEPLMPPMGGGVKMPAPSSKERRRLEKEMRERERRRIGRGGDGQGGERQREESGGGGGNRRFGCIVM